VESKQWLLQDLVDPTVEALDHAVGLRTTRRDEAVFDLLLCTGLVGRWSPDGCWLQFMK
jgi:hypothetical protein